MRFPMQLGAMFIEDVKRCVDGLKPWVFLGYLESAFVHLFPQIFSFPDSPNERSLKNLAQMDSPPLSIVLFLSFLSFSTQSGTALHDYPPIEMQDSESVPTLSKIRTLPTRDTPICVAA